MVVLASMVLVSLAPVVSSCAECEAECPTPEVLVVVPEPTDVAVRLCSDAGCTAWTAPVTAAQGRSDRQVLIVLPDADTEYDVQARDASGATTRNLPFALGGSEETAAVARAAVASSP